MNFPIDTCENGSCAFTLRVGYDAKCFAANVGLGGGHFPETAVIVVYQCADGMLFNDSRALPQGGFEQRHRHDILDAGNSRNDDMGDLK